MADGRKDTISAIPERCPVCNKKKKKILIHIKATESCMKNIDSKTYDDWKLIAKKETKKCYQRKFVQNGGHKEAKKKYIQKLKTLEEEKKRLEEIKRWKTSWMYEQYHDFSQMCKQFILPLQAGKIPSYSIYRSFELGNPVQFINRITPVGETILLNENEMHCWLSGLSESKNAIDSKLLEAIMTLRILMKVSETQWLSAIKTVEEGVKTEKLYQLLGRLKGWQNPNTKNIHVSEKYFMYPELIHESKKIWPRETRETSSVTKKEEDMILSLIGNLLGPDVGLIDQDIQKLLGIQNDVDKLFVALSFTKLK